VSFFDSIAVWLINFIKSCWVYMKFAAGTIVNGVVGVLPGSTHVDETMAAIFLYGGLVAIAVAWLWFGKALKFKN